MKLIANPAPVDQQAIEDFRIPSLLLMEAAATHVAEAVAERADSLKDHIVVLCGPGNNGGDGLACARKLLQMGFVQVSVLHVPEAESYTGDAATNFRLLSHYPGRLTLTHIHYGATAREILATATVVIDALFGSGLTRPVEGLYAEIVDAVNQSWARVVSVDVPSGITTDTGQALGTAVMADMTVTFAASKPGLHLLPGRDFAGKIRVVDIGIPDKIIQGQPDTLQLITEPAARELLPYREPDAHKYSVGSIMVVAGCREMPGAAKMVAESALIAGAGMVTLAAPHSTFGYLDLRPEVIRALLPETGSGHLCPESVETIMEACAQKKCRVLALGPGLGTAPETLEAVKLLLQKVRTAGIALVLDADGLNLMATLMAQGETDLLGEHTLLTPHAGEAQRLLGWEPEKIISDRPATARALQGKTGGTVILKAPDTMVASPRGQVWLNSTGNPGMATAGSGDVLTGLLSGLMAQRLSPLDAARLGVFLHGRAGDLAARNRTVYGLRAMDIAESYPEAVKTLVADS